MTKAKKPRRRARKKAASKRRAAKSVRSKASAVGLSDWVYSGTCTISSYHPTATQLGGLDLPDDDDDDCGLCFITGVLFTIAGMIVISWLWWVFS